MNKWRSYIGLMLLLLPILSKAGNTISIPLEMRVIYYAPQDKPTGSTPDPTDPNQFRASLTGDVLHIETQKDAVSFVVIRSTAGDAANEDYFYGLSYGSIDCQLTQTGVYTIEIGCWKTDFIGQIEVKEITTSVLNGQILHAPSSLMPYEQLHPGFVHILCLKTSLGSTFTKFIPLP